MNRRQFLQHGAMAAVAVSVAPAAVLAAESLCFAFAAKPSRPIDDDSIYHLSWKDEHGLNYYSIQWPTTNETYTYGELIMVDGLPMLTVREASS